MVQRGPVWMSVLGSLLVVAGGGCRPALIEENALLREQITSLQGQLERDEDRVHELEHELDRCEEEVDRKAVRDILTAVDVDPARPLYARLDTSMGAIELELFPAQAPRTVASFVGLAEGTRAWTDPATGELREGIPLYRDLSFHRVIAGFVIQTGDPLGDGTGGPGYTFPDEFSSELSHDHAGVLSMANSGPDSNGSQFFITLDAARHLNAAHTIFGRVTGGMDVVQAIGAVPVVDELTYRPVREITLRSVTVLRD